MVPPVGLGDPWLGAAGVGRRGAVGVGFPRARAGARHLAADSVLLAGALEPDLTLYDALVGSLPEVDVTAVGDCTGLGLIRKAVEDGARVAAAL